MPGLTVKVGDRRGYINTAEKCCVGTSRENHGEIEEMPIYAFSFATKLPFLKINKYLPVSGTYAWGSRLS